MAVAAALALTGSISATAATTNPDPGSLEVKNASLSDRAATEGMVLLENRDHALPIAKSGNVALFGVGAYKTVKGGTGSGEVNNRYMISVRQGFENAGYTVTTSDAYYDAMVAAYDAKYPAGSGSMFGPAIDYSSVDQRLTRDTVRPKAATDTAFYVIARNAGEGADRSAGKGDYQLTDLELDNIQMVGQTYKHVIVLLNVGGVTDTAWFDAINAVALDPAGGTCIDSIFLMSQPGQEGGNALVKVLNGTITPSGKTVDTWASKYSYYPASATFGANDGKPLSEDYTEGIYVGYRYFDSFYRTIDPANPAGVVAYPFGYGLSYTDFSIEPLSVKADAKTVSVRARVTNVGTKYAGKDVVQVYFSAPSAGLDKPYQELAGYAKTDSLAPGAAQTVTITFDTTAMSSFDIARAAEVMDPGTYLIRLGDSSRHTQVVAKLTLGAGVVTEQVTNQANKNGPAAQLAAAPANFYSYPTQAAEIAAAPTVALTATAFPTKDSRTPYAQDHTVAPASPYYALDNGRLSSVDAYVDPAQTDWEGTGKPYAPKTGEKIVPTTPVTGATLFDVAKGKTTMRQFVAGLNVEQLANIVEGASVPGSTLTAAGAAGYTTGKYENLGIPVLTLSDGPAGLRLTQKSTTTPTQYQWATAFPIGTLLAQTWNPDLIREVGVALGTEMAEYGVTLWLAPGMNIHRDPLNGRNFEYYSEDPLVTGMTAAAVTQGVQSIPGVGVTLKHYAANSQEVNRMTTDALIGERALREIYLKGFETAVKAGQPMSVMTSYNMVNNRYTAASYDLDTNVLRGEWGFKGVIMTDWTSIGYAGILGAMYAGNDLVEPGNAPNDVINAFKKVPAGIDVDGMPNYTKSEFVWGGTTYVRYAFEWGGFTPAATGAETISTTVDATTDLTKVPSSGTPYASVDDAYRDAAALLAGSAFNAAQKAAITITDVTRAVPADPTSPVVAYTVNIKGSYPSQYLMRLGDVQRSAMNILNVAMQSAQFKQLAALKGVAGITVGSYTGQFTDLHEPMTAARTTVIKPPSGTGPTVTLVATPAAPASGWYKAPVTVAVTVSDPDARTYIDVDTGELFPYTKPVTVAGDGTHTVRALAVDDDGEFSKIAELTIRIDTVAPIASVKSAEAGVLTLTATDALSGVNYCQYSVDAGKTWTKYSAPATIAGAPKTVQYRAVDKAGNVSAAKSVVVKGKITLTTPVIVGKQVYGQTLTVSVRATPSAATLSYQWLRDGKPITNAYRPYHRINMADKGHRISVRVTASRTNYTSVTKTSAQTVKIK